MTLRIPKLGQSGLAALEFAMVGPLVLAFVMSLGMIPFLYAAQADLDEATARAARVMQTSSTAAKPADILSFRSSLYCGHLILLNCNNVKFSLQKVTGGYKAASATAPLTAQGFPVSGLSYDVGAPTDLMLMRAYYVTGLPAWPVDVSTIVSTQAYQNEIE